MPEYPEFCWTELIVNAVAHRDYSIKGTDIQIKMFDDHLTVESPGILPGMVRVSNIREIHFSRNPKLVELLTAYDFVKEFGEGVDRVFGDMEAAGLPAPLYRQEEFMLYATLRNKNFGAENASWRDTPHDIPHDGDKLLKYCSVPRSRPEMMEFMGVTNRKYFRERYIKPLLESGQLCMTLPDKPKSKKQQYVAKNNPACMVPHRLPHKLKNLYTKGPALAQYEREFFMVVSGHGLIQQRKIGTEEVLEFPVSG